MPGGQRKQEAFLKSHSAVTSQTYGSGVAQAVILRAPKNSITPYQFLCVGLKWLTVGPLLLMATVNEKCDPGVNKHTLPHLCVYITYYRLITLAKINKGEGM